MRNLLFSEKQLDVRFGGHSMAGAKPVNQDAFAAWLPPRADLRALKGAALCIADGVSSSRRSDVASQILVQEFIDEYFSTSPTESVRHGAGKVLNALNTWLCAQNRANFSAADDASLVSTFSAVVVKGQLAHVFHSGDSRVYLLRAGRLRQLTEDHVRRYNGRWVLSRAMGIDKQLDVQLVTEECQPGDRFVLTTDGVHEWFNEAELSQRLGELLSDNSLEQAAQALCEEALQKGSKDNLSCLLGEVVALPTESIEEAAARLTSKKIPPVMQPGMRIDHYRILNVLHNGTRSCLYLVEDENDHGKQYALKAPSRNFTGDLTYLEGFVRERWLGQHLQHEAIMRSYPSPSDSNFLYSVNEYIDGDTLAQWIVDNPNPSLPKVRQLVAEIVEGLRVLQRHGIIHRDIKPDNFMLDDAGRVKLIDLGTLRVDGLEEITSLFGEAVPVGSVNYIAPEYFLEQQASLQSDMFSLGCMVYEMFSGKLPYNMAHIQRRPPSSYASWHYIPLERVRRDLPEWLDLTLKRATEPNPEHRYDAYSEFVEDLNQPSTAILRAAKRRPLLERDPLRFWQMVSAVLLLVVVAQAVL